MVDTDPIPRPGDGASRGGANDQAMGLQDRRAQGRAAQTGKSWRQLCEVPPMRSRTQRLTVRASSSSSSCVRPWVGLGSPSTTAEVRPLRSAVMRYPTVRSYPHRSRATIRRLARQMTCTAVVRSAPGLRFQRWGNPNSTSTCRRGGWSRRRDGSACEAAITGSPIAPRRCFWCGTDGTDSRPTVCRRVRCEPIS